jgi:hypothetical protein
MRFFSQLFVLSLILCLTACAQPNVVMPNSFWQNHRQKIAIATFKAPNPGLYQAGEEGLLDIAINNAMTSDLSDHLKNADVNWYYNLSNQYAAGMRKRRGVPSKIYSLIPFPVFYYPILIFYAA